MESILLMVKTLLGISDKSFDLELTTFINSIFAILADFGLPENFKIKDEATLWSEYLIDPECLELVKSYLTFKVRLFFDPPQNSFLVSNLKEQLDELGWRILSFMSIKNAVVESLSNELEE